MVCGRRRGVGGSVPDGDPSRWGVWAITFPEAMKTKDAMQRNLAAVLPKLKEKWLRWKEQYI